MNDTTIISQEKETMEQAEIYQVENEVIDEQLHEGFVIDNDTKAEWAIRKIAEIRAEFSRYEMVCKNAISVYETKMQLKKQEMERNIGGLTGMLQHYAESVPMKVTKTQATYKLPSGTLKLKFGRPEFVRDEEQLVPWLKENAPEYIKIKESADWAALKPKVSVSGSSVVDENGEAVPGITVVEKPDVFLVED
jgi:phage host-nuclease inhibitor protein Gam